MVRPLSAPARRPGRLPLRRPLRGLPAGGALVALLAALASAPPARAVPDVPLDVYLEHVEPLSLEWPADGTLTDGYGPRWGRMHLGIDVGILESLEVRAATSGTVVESGWITGYEGYGNVVTIDAGRGFTLLYAHLSRSHVVPGQWLDAGDSVGEAGCTGSCTGTHLHFELRENGVPVDPAPYLG
jgi:murein DD-endopeptidase MepM/ murein hydrolase activator NlpD